MLVEDQLIGLSQEWAETLLAQGRNWSCFSPGKPGPALLGEPVFLQAAHGIVRDGHLDQTISQQMIDDLLPELGCGRFSQRWPEVQAKSYLQRIFPGSQLGAYLVPTWGVTWGVTALRACSGFLRMIVTKPPVR